ncbi:hypothetical protein BDV93DRAFT_607937 [Ceratobasidium sp. AG-I]|nr:hypothetical protein BDV93DRAFT_607937 [Ceratobasidium sp. AG-I]
MSEYFEGWNKPVEINTGDYDIVHDLQVQRLHQQRPICQNPFSVLEDNTKKENILKVLSKPKPCSPEEEIRDLKAKLFDYDNRPTWVNLFYDLAWTATFATLTQNGQLNEPWETVSYTAFFVVVWWMWASQVLYSVNYYTNDWFHLGFIFLQLVVFGMLAATTRGFDVTNYILHSPGIPYLDPQTTDQMEKPERYSDDRLAHLSLEIIALAVAISRVLLFIQHLLILRYAQLAAIKKNKAVSWWKICVIPAGLVISIPLFWVAWAITRSLQGRTREGAKLKFIFWGIGLFVEFLSHIIMSHLKWEPEGASASNSKGDTRTRIVPYPVVKMRERLEAITTIILGEGINGIAGTLYSIISTPVLGGPIVINIACAACVIYFLAYLYFEGPTGHRGLEEESCREVYWMFMNLPFLLFIILLLQGMKTQFILTSFLSSARASFGELDRLFSGVKMRNEEVVKNLRLKNYFLRRGLSWQDEYRNLIGNLTQAGPFSSNGDLSGAQKNEFAAWNKRLSLKIMVLTYQNFLGDADEIDQNVTARIGEYYNNLTQPVADSIRAPGGSPGDLYYYQILTAMLQSKLQTTRYIMAIAGLVLIFMATLDLIHSRPRDRYQWGSIISRFSTGFSLVFLLLLNIGRYQSLWAAEAQKSHQAGVFLWLSAYWVLPTITIAFGIQFVIDTILVRMSVFEYEHAAKKKPTFEMKVWSFVNCKLLRREKMALP